MPEVISWRTASRSNYNGECVEMRGGKVAQVRDSKDPDGPVISFSPAAWRVFTGQVQGRPLPRP